ncbi:sulfurtransferase [Naasia lichenicola]|uniref:Sulfurtransferase n=1 Tax=Naasia lichenicola TaxID=2565933 RepID=A0A4S4FML6_9MICO|nr:sulfurtransferase [Naasia lichenicola]THG31693.1 sulfurtransferase [Naasia lichenicola]
MSESSPAVPVQQEDPSRGVLIDSERLAEQLSSDQPPVVLDVRWRLDRPDGRPEYLLGHIPGAVYVSLDDELAAHGAPLDGRHPLPSRTQLQASARRWGIRRGDRVVVADDHTGLSAARAWWLLRAAGIEDVRILDGGYRAWTEAGLPVATGDVVPEAGDVELDVEAGEGELKSLTIEEVAGYPAHGVLLDARAGERYRGEVEPIDPRAGHIPGAVSRPTTENLTSDGRFQAADELRTAFAALGIADGSPVAVYCGSGVTAAHQAAALTIAGFRPVLYPGSWSQWSNHPELPIAVGSTPDGDVRP